MLRRSYVVMWTVACVVMTARLANAKGKTAARYPRVTPVLFWGAPTITVTAPKARPAGRWYRLAPTAPDTRRFTRDAVIRLLYEAPTITVTGHRQPRECAAGRRRPQAQAGDCARAPPRSERVRPR